LQQQRRKQRRCKAYSRSCKFFKKNAGSGPEGGREGGEGREFELRTASNLEETTWWPDTITEVWEITMRGFFFFFFLF
jgi:hypothetical protein